MLITVNVVLTYSTNTQRFSFSNICFAETEINLGIFGRKKIKIGTRINDALNATTDAVIFGRNEKNLPSIKRRNIQFVGLRNKNENGVIFFPRF